MGVITIEPKSISQKDLHNYLLSAVAPRPIALASTISSDGQINLSPFSFFNVFSSNPPILIFSPARRGRDNSSKHTYDNVLEVKECVINVVNYPIVEQMSLSSTEYDRNVNEFIKSGLTETKSQHVAPPRVAEAPVSFECKVNEVIQLGDQGGAGNLVICEVLLIHLKDEYLNDKGDLDTTKLDLVGRMGESWYTRASGDALFEIPKPLSTLGIGVDQLPDHVFSSEVLSGNDLGRLGNIDKIPPKSEIDAWKRHLKSEKIISEDQLSDIVFIHQLTKDLLNNGESERALKTLLIV